MKKYIHKIKQKTSKVNKFTVDTVLYTFGDLLNKGIIFLTIPIFSRMLSTEDYGILSIYQLLFGVLVVLITLNIPGAVTQRLFENKENEDSFISTNFNNCLQMVNKGDCLVLIEDGVFAVTGPFRQQLENLTDIITIGVLQEDLLARGLKNQITALPTITYAQFVELTEQFYPSLT